MGRKVPAPKPYLVGTLFTVLVSQIQNIIFFGNIFLLDLDLMIHLTSRSFSLIHRFSRMNKNIPCYTKFPYLLIKWNKQKNNDISLYYQ